MSLVSSSVTTTSSPTALVRVDMNELEREYEYISYLGACTEGLYWMEDHEYSLREAWESCPRADWLMWFVEAIDVSKNMLNLVIANCLRYAMASQRVDNPYIHLYLDYIELRAVGERVPYTSFDFASDDYCDEDWLRTYRGAHRNVIKAVEMFDWYQGGLGSWHEAYDIVTSAYGFFSGDHKPNASQLRHLKKMADIIRRLIPWTTLERLIARNKKEIL